MNAGGTPAAATLVTTAVAVVLIASGTFQQLVAIASFFLVVNYSVCCLALVVLRRREPERPRPFRAWGYPWSAVLVLAGAAAFLVAAVIGDTINAAAAAALMAAGLIGRALVPRRQRSPAPQPVTPSRRWTLVATILGSSLTFIDVTVVNVALPALQADLHATITDVQWVIEAYALFLGALILVGGSMGDQFGRKRVFLDRRGRRSPPRRLLCGVATTPLLLIVGRALQGIGAAFLVPGSLAIISATFDDAERGRAIGTWSGFSAITTAIGPVTGGWLIEHVSWRAVFFLNVPLALIVIALSLRSSSESRDPSRTSQIDWRGAALAVVGLGGVVFGLLEWPPLGATASARRRRGGSRCARARAAVRASSGAREPDAAARSVPLASVHARQSPHAAALRGARRGHVPRADESHSGSALHGRPQAGAALLPLPFIMFALSRWSGGLVARVGSAAAADHRTRDRRASVSLLYARTGHRRLILDDVLPGDRGARIGHGDHRGAADDDGDGCG